MSNTPPSALEDHLGYWLRLVSNHVSGAFAAALHQHGLTAAEWVVLRHLYDRPATPSRLAVWAGMTRGAISKVVTKLEHKGLIIRWIDPADQRNRPLALTEQGRTLTPELAAIADRNDAHFFAALAPEDRVRLRALMAAMVEAHGWQDVPVD
jgi:DNA-binding MarR family transcriptional regulator